MLKFVLTWRESHYCILCLMKTDEHRRLQVPEGSFTNHSLIQQNNVFPLYDIVLCHVKSLYSNPGGLNIRTLNNITSAITDESCHHAAHTVCPHHIQHVLPYEVIIIIIIIRRRRKKKKKTYHATNCC